MPKSDAQARSVYIKSTFSDSPRPVTNMLRYQSNYREGRRKLDFPLDIYKCGLQPFHFETVDSAKIS